ncbi:hypothetical protein T12_15053 [Trichinella patagoniensis]|uniref:Uncharacterized protein n=1 Tax=Trichinella patagoniensis TaxID=990121 RepID=A0A0V1ADS6_9BILA|nr:hypothetical protein T12_15053 [Trichinella patagoniensis]
MGFSNKRNNRLAMPILSLHVESKIPESRGTIRPRLVVLIESNYDCQWIKEGVSVDLIMLTARLTSIRLRNANLTSIFNASIMRNDRVDWSSTMGKV